MDKKTALLIIDVQVAMFASQGGDTGNTRAEVLTNICTLRERAHKAGVPVLMVQHTDNSDEIYTEGALTWQLHPKMTPLSGDKIIRKTAGDAFQDTRLHEILQEQGIERLIVAGIQMASCIDTTCRTAFSLGYETILVLDAHTTFETAQMNADQVIRHHQSFSGGVEVQFETTASITGSLTGKVVGA